MSSALEFADSLVQQALAAGADAAQVNHLTSERFEINFESSGISLLRTTTGDSTTLTVFCADKKGSVGLNGHDQAELNNSVHSAIESAQVALPDPANQIALVATQAPQQHGPDDCEREAMLDAVLDYAALVKQRYPRINLRTNTYSFVRQQRSFVNSAGVHQQERRHDYQLGSMFCGKDGRKTTSFNYTGAASYTAFEQLHEAGAIQRLLEETIQSFNPQSVPEKFVGDVIITPSCMGTLIGTLTGALSGHALMAGTTPYKERQGEIIASSCFSLLNRPRHPAFPGGADFDDFGVPSKDLDVIVDGVLNAFLVDFYISKKLDIDQTAGVNNFIVPAGDSELDEIIKNTKRGIVLSRFSGGRPNNNLDFSGVAKNSFYIENGEIKFPLIETMVSGNFQELLQNIQALSNETVNFGGSEYPYLAASGVTISGV